MNALETYAAYCNGPYVELLRRLGLDFEVVRAAGAVVEDVRGRQIIDGVAGYGNLNLGHNHPAVLAAVRRILDSGRPCGWPFISDAHARLVERLSDLAPGDRNCAFVVNSGAEAVESALKLARLASGKPGVIACRGAWHGYTLGALSVSEPARCRHFQPLLPHVRHVAFGDPAAVEAALAPEIGAVIVEPIQAENGAVVPPAGYLVRLAEICRNAGVILIFDEIKTGMGKTGKLFACEHEGAQPDVLLLGKSLGGGVMPIGALIARRQLWTKFGLSFAMSSSSAAGNTLACAAALAALEIVLAERLWERAERLGGALEESLQALVTTHPEWVRGVSGRGLLLSLHLTSPQAAQETLRRCLQGGVMLMTAFLDRSRILLEPPLCIEADQVTQMISILHRSLDAMGRRSSHAG